MKNSDTDTIKIGNVLGYVISRTAIQLKTAFQRELKAKGFDITPEHWAILFTVNENDGLYQKQLADKLIKDKPNVTRMLDLLEKRELITRKNDGNDRRIIKIFLTDKGREHMQEVIPLAKKLTAKLTDIITKAWSGKTTKEYKTLKGLKKENLRDNMTNTELILNMLAEASTKDISQAVNPNGFEESKEVAKQGGAISGNARKELEAKTGKKVVTAINAKSVLKEINEFKKLPLKNKNK